MQAIENRFEKFSQADATEAELRKAAERLGAIVEPPSFWSAIANDASMPAPLGHFAIILLVRRHIQPGTTTIGELAGMLDGARWLRPGDISTFRTIRGKIPVTASPEVTAAAIRLPGHGGAIYLAIAGRFPAEEISAALQGRSREGGVWSAVIREAAVAEHGREPQKI